MKTYAIGAMLLVLVFGGLDQADAQDGGEQPGDGASPTPTPTPAEGTPFTTLKASPIGAVVTQADRVDGRCMIREEVTTTTGRLAHDEAILGTFAFDEQCVLRLTDKYVGSERPVLLPLGPDAVRGGGPVAPSGAV